MLLHLENFLCYTKYDVDFTAMGIHYISGSSGSGKSSICKAILFLQTGEGKKLIQHGKKQCVVSLETDSFRIRRQKGPERVQVFLPEGELEGDSADEWLKQHFNVIYMNSDISTHFLKKTATERWSWLQQLICPERWNESVKNQMKKLIVKEEQCIRGYEIALSQLRVIVNEPKFKLSASELPIAKEIYYRHHIGDFTQSELEREERNYFRYMEYCKLLEECNKNVSYHIDEIEEQLHIHQKLKLMGECIKPEVPKQPISRVPCDATISPSYISTCPYCEKTVYIDSKTQELCQLKIDIKSIEEFQRCLKEQEKYEKALIAYDKESEEYENWVQLKVRAVGKHVDWIQAKKQWDRLHSETRPWKPKFPLVDIQKKLQYLKKIDMSQDFVYHHIPLEMTELDEDSFIAECEKARIWNECERLESLLSTSRDQQQYYRHFLNIVIESESECIHFALKEINQKFQTYLDRFFQGDIQGELSIEEVRQQSSIRIKLQYKGETFDIQELSTGEYARVSLALTLVFVEWSTPVLIMLDECVAHLDQDNALCVFETIRESMSLQTTRILLIAHQVVTGLFEHVVEL